MSGWSVYNPVLCYKEACTLSQFDRSRCEYWCPRHQLMHTCGVVGKGVYRCPVDVVPDEGGEEVALCRMTGQELDRWVGCPLPPQETEEPLQSEGEWDDRGMDDAAAHTLLKRRPNQATFELVFQYLLDTCREHVSDREELYDFYKVLTKQWRADLPCTRFTTT